MLDKLILDIGQDLDIGEKIQIIAKELLIKMFDPSTGGLHSFIEKFKSVSNTNLDSSEITELLALLNNATPSSLENAVTQLLGRDSISKIAYACGMENGIVISTVSSLFPKILNIVAPSGKIPLGIPDIIAEYVPTLAKIAQIQKNNIPSAVPLQASFAESHINYHPLTSYLRHSSWAIPTAVIILLAWLGWNWINKNPNQIPKKISYKLMEQEIVQPALNSKIEETNSPQSELQKAINQDSNARAALAPQALESDNTKSKSNTSDKTATKQIPASLYIKNLSGKISLQATVVDQSTRDAILSKFQTVFGSDNINADITINDKVSTPKWLANLESIISKLNISGLKLSISGESIRISGSLPRSTLNALMLEIKASLGNGFSIASEPDTSDKAN